MTDTWQVTDASVVPIAAALHTGSTVARVVRSRPGEGRSTALDALTVLLNEGSDGLQVVMTRCLPGRQARGSVLGALHAAASCPSERDVSDLPAALHRWAPGQRFVLLVDDVQHADEASAAALARMAACLTPPVVGLVVTSPSGVALSGGLDALPSVELAGLTDEQLHTLLDRSGSSSIPAPVAQEIITLCQRHPTVVREVTALLTCGQLQGRVPLPSRPPLGPESLRILSRPLHALSRATRQLLLLLVVADGDVSLALAACSSGLGELAPAEHAGLIRIHGGRCRWNPWLLADAVVQSTPTAERLQAVRALMAACGDREGSLRRVKLIARAGVGPASAEPGESVVTLTMSGRLSEAYETAFAAMSRARRGGPRSRFRTAAAELAWLSGYPDHSMDLLADREPDEPDDASAQVLRWAIEGVRDTWPAARRFTAPAAEEPSLAARVTGTALADGWETLTPGELATVVGGTPTVESRISAGVTALARVVRGESLLCDEEQDALQAMTWWLQPSDALHPRFWPPPLLPVFLGAEARYERHFSELLGTPFGRTATMSRSLLLGKRACVRWATGRWSDALDDATAGADLAERAHQPALRTHLMRVAAWIHASRGEGPGCAPAVDLAESMGQGSPSQLPWVRALAALGEGRIDVAFDELAELHDGEPRSPHHLVLRRLSTVDLVTAAAWMRQTAQIRPVVAEFETWAQQGTPPWAQMDLARCRALLGGTDAGHWYERALSLAPEVARPAALARTRLEYGTWLRRAKRKREARAQLRAAESAFTVLGASPWARRAVAGLRATGDTAVRAHSGRQELTAQEQRIAELAAEGLSNKQIANALALSRHTVGYHLHKTFAKLHINSRAQLARALDTKP